MQTSISFFLGAVLAIVVAIVIRKSAYKHSCNYDERQIYIRGKGYKIGFITLLVFSCAYIFLCVGFEELLQYGYLWNTISMFLSLTIFAVFSIWNDAFFSLKQNPKKYLVLCAVVIACNSIGIVEVISGRITALDLIFSYKIINALCALSFLVIVVTIIIKIMTDRKEQD